MALVITGALLMAAKGIIAKLLYKAGITLEALLVLRALMSLLILLVAAELLTERGAMARTVEDGGVDEVGDHLDRRLHAELVGRAPGTRGQLEVADLRHDLAEHLLELVDPRLQLGEQRGAAGGAPPASIGRQPAAAGASARARDPSAWPAPA